jgi:hypothetical protein
MANEQLLDTPSRPRLVRQWLRLTNHHLVGGGRTALVGDPKKRDRQARQHEREREQPKNDTIDQRTQFRVTHPWPPRQIKRAFGTRVAAWNESPIAALAAGAALFRLAPDHRRRFIVLTLKEAAYSEPTRPSPARARSLWPRFGGRRSGHIVPRLLRDETASDGLSCLRRVSPLARL